MYVKTEKETILLYCLLSDDAAPFYSQGGGVGQGESRLVRQTLSNDFILREKPHTGYARSSG